MTAVQDVARILAGQEPGRHLEWTLPTGFPVRQRAFIVESDRVWIWEWSPTERRKVQKKLSFSKPTVQLDSSEAAKQAVANLIHSIDACHLMRTVAHLSRPPVEVSHVATIHDSYGVHANNVERLRRQLFRSFRETHGAFTLTGCWAQWERQSAAPVPEHPPLGNLDLADIKFNPHGFA